MLVNSRKFGSRRWTLCLALLAVLALSSCKKQEPAATTSPGAESGAASSSGAKSTKATSKTSKALSPAIQKLGVKPTGTNCPSNAPIKGNLGKASKKLYHEAKSAGYKAVKPEICFKDVATAKKAGFQAPQGAKKQ